MDGLINLSRNTNGALFNKPLTDEQLIKWAIWIFIVVKGKKYYFIKDKLPYRLGYIYNKIYVEYKNKIINVNDLIMITLFKYSIIYNVFNSYSRYFCNTIILFIIKLLL